MKFKNITNKHDPYLIAEIGVNHENNLKIAEKIIKQAKIGGADAVKFQTYKADKIAAENSPYYWDLKKNKIRNQRKLFQKYDKFNKEDYIKLKKICDYYKIDFLSTPFDIQSAIFLNKLVKFFKIASSDLTNLILIDCLCKFKKPLLVSTGASNFKEILSLDKYFIKNYKNLDIAYMHCVLSYPTKYKDANLNMIKYFTKKLPHRVIGYSDHTLPDPGSFVLLEAYNYGAKIIEKHFTLDVFKGKKGNDHFHAMSFEDFDNFRKKIILKKMIKGNYVDRKVLMCEKKSRLNARRSIFSLGSIKKNTILTKENIIAKRPGTGISPLFYKKLIGKKLRKNVSNEHKFSWSDFY